MITAETFTVAPAVTHGFPHGRDRVHGPALQRQCLGGNHPRADKGHQTYLPVSNIFA